jgi:hypothetical protein
MTPVILLITPGSPIFLAGCSARVWRGLRRATGGEPLRMLVAHLRLRSGLTAGLERSQDYDADQFTIDLRLSLLLRDEIGRAASLPKPAQEVPDGTRDPPIGVFDGDARDRGSGEGCDSNCGTAQLRAVRRGNAPLIFHVDTTFQKPGVARYYERKPTPRGGWLQTWGGDMLAGWSRPATFVITRAITAIIISSTFLRSPLNGGVRKFVPVPILFRIEILGCAVTSTLRPLFYHAPDSYSSEGVTRAPGTRHRCFTIARIFIFSGGCPSALDALPS